MPNSFNECYAKPRKMTKFRRFFAVVFWMLIGVLICFCGKFIADLLTGEVGGSVKIKLDGVSVFLLHFGEYDNIDEARECVVWVENAGGAGYIEKRVKYVVVGRPYFSKDDAENVKSNMVDLKYEATVLSLSLKPVSINTSGIKTGEKKEINKVLHSIKSWWEKVDEIDKYIDLNKMTNIGACNELSGLKSEIKTAQSNLSIANLNYSNRKINSVISYLLDMQNEVDLATNKLLTSINETSTCKYLLSSFVLKYANLLSTIA